MSILNHKGVANKYTHYLELKKLVLNDETTTNFVKEFLGVPHLVARFLVKDWWEQAEKIEELEIGNEELDKEIAEHCETKGLLGRQVFALTKRVDILVEEKAELSKFKKDAETLFQRQKLGFANSTEKIERYEKALKEVIKLGKIGANYESLESQIAKLALENSQSEKSNYIVKE